MKCLILFSLFGAAMLLSFLMQTMRKDGVALSPVIPWVITGLGVVGGAVGYDILLGGFRSLFSFRPDRDILPALCFTVTLLHSAAMSALKDAFLSPNIQLYLPLGLLSLAVCCAGRLNLLKAAFRNLRMIQAEGGKYVPHKISDSRLAGELTRGMIDQFPVTAVNQRSDGLRDFLKFSFSADRSDLLSRNLAVIGLCAAAVCGVFTYLFNRDVPFAFTAATVSFGVFAPAMNALITAFPLKNVSGLMARAGGMVASEKSALEYENVNSVLLDAQSLFPPSMVVLSGIKTFAGMRIDEAIVDAASVLREAGSIFSGIFFKMIGGNVSLLRPVEQLSYEDNLGLSAWVNNKRLLIGNREFLENHGVTMPSEDYEKRFIAEGSELLYLASAGDLTAVFVVSIHASIQTEDACQMLADNGIGMSVRTIDPIVRPEILEKLFSVAPYFFKIVPGRLHEDCRRLSEDVIGRPAMTVNNGTALSLACSLCASKRLKVFITVLQLIQTISILVNIVTVAVLSFLGNFSGLTGLVAAAAQLGWMLIGLLIQRSFRI